MTNTLLQQQVNDEIIIHDFLDSSMQDQLISIGFTPGTPVKVVSKLPFDGAVTCECRNTRFALRAEDAAQIVIKN